MDGLLIVDKPGLVEAVQMQNAEQATPSAAVSPMVKRPGESALPRLYTSHDIVQRVRRWSKQKRIGHTGTLDPMASGVMVLCLGKATRLVEYYQGHAKQYVAEIALGRATDSYDATGETVMTSPVPKLNESQIEAALQRFRGELQQLPPIFSALKQAGESLHYKARRGEEVTVLPRTVTFYQLDLLHYLSPDRIIVRARCSAGTYIRSLAYDLGLALGTQAHLAGLRREAAGAFTLAQAHTLASLEQAAQTGQLADLLLPAGYGLDLPSLAMDESSARRLGQGQKVVLPSASVEATRLITLAQAYDAHGELLGIVRCLGRANAGEGLLWQAEKWLAEQ
jgi:tRNA pseudouridine55 synthase